MITDARDQSKWKAAVLGGFYAVVAGPIICYVVFAASLALNGSVRQFASFLGGFWIFTLLSFGVPAFVLGAGGALLLQAVGPRCHSMRLVLVLAGLLGLVLGGAVPLMPIPFTWGPIGPAIKFVPFAAVAGAFCELLVVFILLRRRLLRLGVPTLLS